MLRNCVFLASRRSRPEKKRQMPIERSRTSGCSIWLNQPMNRVARARGMRLVSRKLSSSCKSIFRIWDRTVMLRLTLGDKPRIDGARPHHACPLRARRRRPDDVAGEAEDAAGALEGEAPVVDRACPDGTADCLAGAVLRIRRGAI